MKLSSGAHILAFTSPKIQLRHIQCILLPATKFFFLSKVSIFMYFLHFSAMFYLYNLYFIEGFFICIFQSRKQFVPLQTILKKPFSRSP